MKLFPDLRTVLQRALGDEGRRQRAGRRPDGSGEDQDLFFRRLYVNYTPTTDPNPENVKVERNDNGWNLTVNYEVRRPLIDDLDIVGTFNKTQAPDRWRQHQRRQ